MPCNKCMLFIHDCLQQTPHPSSRHATQFKRGRLLGCIETVSYLLAKQIEIDRPDMYEWLNMMEMMNCAVLNQQASRDYRMYQIWLTNKNTIDEIITILIENAILSKTQSRYPYEEWFAEKGMFLLQNLRQIHIEHSGAKFIKIKAPVDEYDGLYS